MKRKVLGALLLAFGLSVGVAQGASFFTLSLSVQNGGLPAGSGPWGTLDISTSGNTATFTLTATNSPNIFVLSDLGLNLAPAVDVTSYSVAQTWAPGHTGTWSPSSPTIASGQRDGFGDFNFVLDTAQGRATQVTITMVSSDPWGSTLADILMPVSEKKPYMVAAHFFPVSSTTGEKWEIAGSTGWAADGNPVPIPGAALLLGSGLAAFGIFRRRS